MRASNSALFESLSGHTPVPTCGRNGPSCRRHPFGTRGESCLHRCVAATEWRKNLSHGEAVGQDMSISIWSYGAAKEIFRRTRKPASVWKTTSSGRCVGWMTRV